MLADAHLHLFRNGFPGVYGRPLIGSDIDVYEAFRARHDIAAGLVVGYEGDGIDPDNNAYIRGLAATRPWLATLAYVAPDSHPSADAIAALLDAGHAGLAVYIPDVAAAEAFAAWDEGPWRVLDERGAIVSFNVGLTEVGALTPVADAFPGCRLVVSHMGLPSARRTVPEHAAAEAELAPLLALATRPNVFVKLSGFYAVSDPAHDWPHAAAAPFVAALLARFGPERCLWGSDFSPALDHVSFAQSIMVPGLEAHDDATRAAVMGGNLLRLLARS